MMWMAFFCAETSEATTSIGWSKRNLPVVSILKAQEGSRRKHLQCSQSDSAVVKVERKQSWLSIYHKCVLIKSKYSKMCIHLRPALSSFFLSLSYPLCSFRYTKNSIRLSNHTKHLKTPEDLQRDLAILVNSIYLPLPGDHYRTSDIKNSLWCNFCGENQWFIT